MLVSAAAARDANAAWQAWRTYARALISTQRSTPQQNGARKPGWHAFTVGWVLWGKRWNTSIHLLQTVVQQSYRSFDLHTKDIFELERPRRLWLVQRSPHLLHISLTFKSSVIYRAPYIDLSNIAIYRRRDGVILGLISLFCSLAEITPIVNVLPQAVEFLFL